MDSGTGGGHLAPGVLDEAVNADETPHGGATEADRNRFTPHPPIGDQNSRYELIRATALTQATLYRKLCPASDELEKAIDHLDAAAMLANAAIARHGGTPEES